MTYNHAYGEYKATPAPPMSAESKKQIARASAALKSLPRPARDALLAETLGLTFSISGRSTLASEGGAQTQEALYIGSDAKLHEYWAEARKLKGDKWANTQNLIKKADKSALLAGWAKEITRLVMVNAKYHLADMPETLREAWLAHAADHLYLPGGQEAYMGEQSYTLDNGSEISVRLFSPDALYCNSRGKECKATEITEKFNKVWFRRWLILHHCASLIGRDDLLALYPKEVDAMANGHEHIRSKAAQESARVNLPALLTEAAPGKVQAALDFLRSCPTETREALLADMLGLTFSPAGDSVKASNGWQTGASSYFGSDGKKHLYWDGNHLIGDGRWSYGWSRINAAGSLAVLHACSADVYRLVLSNAKGHLASMPQPLRDAWLADAAGLLTTPDGGSAYTGALTTYQADNGQAITHKAYHAKAGFEDSTGARLTMADTLARYSAIWSRRFALLYRCAALIGADSVLEAFANEVSAIRTHNPSSSH